MNFPDGVAEVIEELEYSIKFSGIHGVNLRHDVWGDIYIGWSECTHYMVRPSLPRNTYADAPSGIRISKKKSPQKIADEIRLRLLKNYTPIWRIAQEQLRKREEVINQQTQALKQAQNILPTLVIQGEEEYQTARFYHSALPHQSFELRPSTYGIQFDGTLHPDDLKILLEAINRRLAAKLEQKNSSE